MNDAHGGDEKILPASPAAPLAALLNPFCRVKETRDIAKFDSFVQMPQTKAARVEIFMLYFDICVQAYGA